MVFGGTNRIQVSVTIWCLLFSLSSPVSSPPTIQPRFTLWCLLFFLPLPPFRAAQDPAEGQERGCRLLFFTPDRLTHTLSVSGFRYLGGMEGKITSIVRGQSVNAVPHMLELNKRQ